MHSFIFSVVMFASFIKDRGGNVYFPMAKKFSVTFMYSSIVASYLSIDVADSSGLELRAYGAFAVAWHSLSLSRFRSCT